MPAPLPRPRGAALVRSGRTRSPVSGQPSGQLQESRQPWGKAAPKRPSTGHSASSLGLFPPLLPSLPRWKGGEPAAEPSAGRGGPTVPSKRAALPGGSRGTRPFSRAGQLLSPESRSYPSGELQPQASLPPPPPASPPAPASEGSRSPPLGELQTRKQLPPPPHPRREPRAARFQVHRTPAPAPAPSGPRGRGARPAARGPALRWVDPRASPRESSARLHRPARPLCSAGSGRALRVRGHPGRRPKRKGLVAQPEQTPEAWETGLGRDGRLGGRRGGRSSQEPAQRGVARPLSPNLPGGLVTL